MMIEKVMVQSGAKSLKNCGDRKIKGKESKKERSHDDRKSDDSIRGKKSNK